jgi:hypothetical protein
LEGQIYPEIAKGQCIIDVSSFSIVIIMQVFWDIDIIVQNLVQHEEIHQFFAQSTVGGNPTLSFLKPVQAGFTPIKDTQILLFLSTLRVVGNN